MSSKFSQYPAQGPHINTTKITQRTQPSQPLRIDHSRSTERHATVTANISKF
jgi:multidrug resistance efflux pump